MNSVASLPSRVLTSTIRSSAADLPRLVILGHGWATFTLLRNINRWKKNYRVIVVSPRNHFLFTPLLCSTTVGTLEFRWVSWYGIRIIKISVRTKLF